MNTLKNLTKKAIAVGTGAVMIATTIAGAAALDLKDYPAPFVKDGQFNGLIVVGEKAATSDVLGSIEIASSLQAASTTVVSSSGSSTAVSGDAKKIGDAGDILEVGEYFGAVTETLTEDDLAFLKGGIVSTDSGDTDFVQTLEFSGLSFADSNNGKVGLYENNDDEVGTYLFFNDRDPLFRYELEFTSGLESDIDTADGPLVDLEDESLYILGQYFSVVSTDSDDTAGSNDIVLNLIAGDVTDTLKEGETKTYTVDGKSIEVTVLFVGDGSTASAKFLVNGQATKSLAAGDTEKVGDIEFGVRDVLSQSRGTTGGTLVEFYVGANKLELTDTDTDTAGSGTVKVNGETIEDADLDISATVTSSSATITKIAYTLDADAVAGDSDVYLKKGEGIRGFLDEPAGMLADKWDITFQGVSQPDSSVIDFQADGDDQYDVTVTNRRGDEYTFPFLYAGTSTDNNGNFGDDQDALVFYEYNADASAVNVPDVANDYAIGIDDYFVITDMGSAAQADNGDDSYVLQFNDVDEGSNKVLFQTAGEGKEISAPYTGTLSTLVGTPTAFTITVGGKDFDAWVYDSGAGVYKLAVDLDNDGVFATNGANTTGVVDFVTKGGGILRLSNSTFTSAGAILGPNIGNVNTTITTLADDIDSTTQTAIRLNFDETGDQVDISTPTASAGTLYSKSVRGEDRSLGLTNYGMTFEKTDDTTDSDSITFVYPAEQVEALVYVVGGDVSTSTVAGGEGVRVNPIKVGSAVLDKDVRADQANMIVVGGPCVNTAAAALLGNPADCVEGFTMGSGVIKMFDTGNNVAILVAGYSAQDTQGASRVLAQYSDYSLSGMEADVSVTSLTQSGISVKNK